MKRRRYVTALAVTVVAIAAALCTASWVTGFAPGVVLSDHAVPDAPGPKDTIGTRVAPLRDLNFDEGEWAAYIWLEFHDWAEVRGELPRNCLKLTDREALKRIQHEFVGRYTGADVATVISRLHVVHDGRIVHDSGIVLSGRDLKGLQTSSWGWVEPENPGVARRFADLFKPVYWPICVQ